MKKIIDANVDYSSVQCKALTSRIHIKVFIDIHCEGER